MPRPAVWICLLGGPLLAQIQHATPMAGRWFPADPVALNKSLADAIGKAQTRALNLPPRKGLLALIAPHAGIEYSGMVAAGAFRLVNSPKTVLLVGFSHQTPLTGVVIPRVSSYTTPLGEIKVDSAAARELGFAQVEENSLCDHSLENLLPFVQKAAPGAMLVPLYAGAMNQQELQAAAQKLASRLTKGDLIVASSDFTHHGKAYQYAPFAQDKQLPQRLRERAMEAFEHAGSLNVAGFDRFLARTGDTICGRDPIRLLMAALARFPERVYMETADTQSSGEVTGDWSLSVSYGALAFYRASAYTVGPQSQRRLLAHSRAALEALYDGRPAASIDTTGELRRREGVFVTIRKQGQLRGCIGNLEPRTLLPDTVADRTLAAARSDPRFPPLTRAEGPVDLEISLLTPLKRLFDWKEFRVGQGALLVLASDGGLLLPQVAKEMNWNRDQFLEGLSQKAGLDPKAYRDPKAKLYVFDAQVFGER